MSDKISYILEVQDNFSTATTKFKKQITAIDGILKSLNNELDLTSTKLSKFGKGLKFNFNANADLDKLSKSMDKVATSAGKMRKATAGFNASEEILSATKNNSAYRGSARPVFAGPFSKIKFDNETGGWVSAEKNKVAGYSMAGLLGGRLGASGIASGLGFATAAYTVGRSVKYVHDTTVQMDSLRASLSALIPKVKGLEVATPESEVQYLRGVSDKYGLNFSDIAPAYVKMLGTGGKTDASLAKGLVENIGGYAGLLRLSGPATQDTMRGFQDMLTKQVLNAQEVKLQMQQLVGAQPMMHKAFYRIAQRQAKAEGKKSPVTMENASMYFQAAMGTGTLSSDLMLREFIKVIEEDFGKKMLEKANKLGNEERRLASATQELATSFGDLTYGLQIGTVRGLTRFTKGLNDVTNDAGILGGYLSNLLSDKAKQIKDSVMPNNPEVRSWLGRTSEVAGGTAVDALKMTYGFPLYGIKYGGGMLASQVAGVLGDEEMKNDIQDKLKKDFVANNFEHLQSVYNNEWKVLVDALNANSQAILQQNQQQNQQKVEVKITTENMPDFFKVKQDQNMSLWRPQTIGGR